VSDNIKWFPAEIFALMGADQLRAILTEIEKEDPELVKRVLTRRGHKIFGTDRRSDA
jgi:flagellar motor switch protein FliG